MKLWFNGCWNYTSKDCYQVYLQEILYESFEVIYKSYENVIDIFIAFIILKDVEGKFFSLVNVTI